ncbi:MAG: DUF4838 domain-containing protein [Clostridia bacterium]|nr:DUF4838 domain-containing protein [Clostridia bacterium]
MALWISRDGKPMLSAALSATASELERYAAKELRDHVEKVTGAVLTLSTGTESGPSVWIGTPDSIPKLKDLFPEDLSWLSATLENGKRYGSDGFAVRSAGNSVWIFGATPRGAINGVYDFLEKNLGVFWFRSDEETGLVFDPLPTAEVRFVDYREKSPFEVRGWNLCANGGDFRTEHMLMRNKLNTVSWLPSLPVTEESDPDKYAVRLGMKLQAVTHNLHSLVLDSPIYDPDCVEYWNTDEQGKPLFPPDSNQVNPYSQKTAETIAATLNHQIESTGTDVVFIGIQDYSLPGRNVPEDTKPFEYAPGKFVAPANKPYVRWDYCPGKHVAPEDEVFISTVWFSFINRIARIVKQSHPEAVIQTFAYFFAETPPLCPLEDNVHLVFAPLTDEDLSAYYSETGNIHSAKLVRELDGWSKLTPEIVIYNYYGCFAPSRRVERACWNKIRSDLQFYSECNFSGLFPEGVADCKGFVNSWAPDDPDGSSAIWDLNALTFWLYSKLAWNPEAEIDPLIDLFCDRYYGSAAAPMRNYYTLLRNGWELGRKDSIQITVSPDDPSYYMETFVRKWDLQDRILLCLREAWDLADEAGKRRIRRIKEVFESYFLTQGNENA